MQSMRMRPTVNLLPMLCGLRVVCLSDTTFSPTKTVELIQVLCRVETQIGPCNHLLDGYPGKGAISAQPGDLSPNKNGSLGQRIFTPSGFSIGLAHYTCT